MSRRPVAWLGALASVAASTMPGAIVAAPGARAPSPYQGGVNFSARLAQAPPITGPSAWEGSPGFDPWKALSTAADRQPTRWTYARTLIGRGRGAEALGVLTVMRQDDPDLDLVDAFRLATGAALVLAGRGEEAIRRLSPVGEEAATVNPERCAWRMRALAATGRADAARQDAECARPALRARTRGDRDPFLLSAGRAAVEAGRPRQALAWLAGLPDRDPAANLYRARAFLALGAADQARLRLGRTEVDGTVPLRMHARLTSIEAGLANRSLSPRRALLALDRLRYVWRGDAIEARALLLSFDLDRKRGDAGAALATGATLLRHADPRYRPAGLTGAVAAQFDAVLAPTSRLPVARAAGLFWDNRDMLPPGPEGDRLVIGLADRLEQAGLYDRAAQLLEYQLTHRAGDLARGPLSARAAGLLVLAGQPARAITLLHRTDRPDYPAAMTVDRRRIAAVALSRIGRVDQALALLDEVPGSVALRAEILWKEHRWQMLARTLPDMLPPSPRAGLSAVDQTVILRQAIALAMLGRDADLSTLRQRYGAAFARLPVGPVFDLLSGTNPPDPLRIARAMAALPAVSPAGDAAMLLDISPARAT